MSITFILKTARIQYSRVGKSITIHNSLFMLYIYIYICREQIPRLRSDLVESIYIGEGDNRREEHYNPFSESYNPFEYN